MKVDSTIVVLAAFPAPAAFSGFLVLTDDNSKAKTSEYAGTQLDEIASDESSFKEFSSESLSSGNEISSPEISVEPGIYRCEITLDNNFSFEQEVRAEHVTEPGSSEKLRIDLIDHPEYPIDSGIESA